MSRFLVIQSIIAALAVFGQAAGDGCRRVQQFAYNNHYQAQQAQVYVAKDVHYTRFLEVPVTYPLYSVGYGSGEEIRQLKEKLHLMQQQQQLLIQQQQLLLQQGRPVTPPAFQQQLPPAQPGGQQAPLPAGAKTSPYQKPEFAAFVREHCASCHGTAPKGNKLSLMLDDNDTLLDVGLLQRKEMFLRVALPKAHPKFMPKASEPVPGPMLGLFAENAMAE